MAAGMNWGIFSLLGVVAFVLGGVAAFFIYLARRPAKVAPLVVAAGPAKPYGRGDPLLRRSDAHIHLAAGRFQPGGRVGHRCARGRAYPDTGVSTDDMRRMVPGSAHRIL